MSEPKPTRQDAAVARLVLSRHRLHGALQQASGGSAAGTFLGQMVQSHPWAAVALALSAGGLVSRLRPWRWLLKAELWAALLPPLMAALATAPLGAWADVLQTLMRQATPAPCAPMPAATPAAPAVPATASAAPSKNA